MPLPLISIAEVAANRRTVDANIGTEEEPTTVPVVYRPNALTPELELTLAALDARTEEGMAALLGLFCETVVDWGLGGPLTGSGKRAGEQLVPAGKKVPLEPEYLRHVGSAVISRIMQAVRDDVADPKPSTTSKA